MIKTPVTYDHRNDQIIDSDNNVIAYDVDYRFAEDQVKRINLHDDMVKYIQERFDYLKDYWATPEDLDEVKQLGELLERCK